MGLISKTYTFLAGTTKAGEAAQINSDYDTIYGEFNGNIEDANIKANAAIAQSKIANLANSLLYASGLVATTRVLFQQTTPPTGWTKETASAYNDAALRMVTGSVTPTGGADVFSTHFGTSKSTAGFTLSTAEIPAHTHAILGTDGSAGGSTLAQITASVANTLNGATQSNAGGGGSHSHTLSNFNIKYVDSVIGVKD